jgi:hypothetical protein
MQISNFLCCLSLRIGGWIYGIFFMIASITLMYLSIFDAVAYQRDCKFYFQPFSFYSNNLLCDFIKIFKLPKAALHQSHYRYSHHFQ